jgi:2,4-dienoyl-CoA reductase-like NADH-dependent reductase (Old Yellow Enzyme family)
VAPSPIPFREGDASPKELSRHEILRTIDDFAAAAGRALEAGFDVVEIHGAHGYLINSFLSPLSNHRQDEYGGPFENRIRYVLDVIRAIRRVWPETLPLLLRISATDWVEGGWAIADSVELARRVRDAGVDLIDCSSGGLVPYAKIELGPGYQVPFAERIRRETCVPTGAVGLITEAEQAEAIIESGAADIVLLAREFLRDPYFAMHAAQQLRTKVQAPKQYLRAFPGSAVRPGRA